MGAEEEGAVCDPTDDVDLPRRVHFHRMVLNRDGLSANLMHQVHSQLTTSQHCGPTSEQDCPVERQLLSRGHLEGDTVTVGRQVGLVGSREDDPILRRGFGLKESTFFGKDILEGGHEAV